MQPQTLVVSYILGFDVAGLHCKSECTHLHFSGSAFQMYIPSDRLLPS